MEVEIRQAVDKTLAQTDADQWVARIDQDPAAVGEHVLQHLDSSVRSTLEKSTRGQSTNGLLHLKGVFDAATGLPDSPKGFAPLPICPPVNAARLTVLAVNQLLGHAPVSYGSENDGHLFVNLVAMPGQGRSAEKSTKGMRGHTDAVSFPFPGQQDSRHPRIAPSPDAVCLAALRNPDDIATMVIPLRQILSRLDEADIEQLKKDQFLITCQGTFKDGTIAVLGDAHQVEDVSVLLSRGVNDFWVRFSHSNVAPSYTAPEATEQALVKVAQACEEVAHPIVLGAGDIVILDNRTMLHGRSEVGKEVGGNARWLLRSYGLASDNIPKTAFHKGSSFKLWP